MFVLPPLQMLLVAEFVTAGAGFTVTTIVSGAPAQEPSVEVGITMYGTVPATVLLGLLKAWLILVPEPARAPVILPVIVPNVQLKLLAIPAVKETLVLFPLQIMAVALVVTIGLGLTVTVIVNPEPAHEPPVDVGVTI